MFAPTADHRSENTSTKARTYFKVNLRDRKL